MSWFLLNPSWTITGGGGDDLDKNCSSIICDSKGWNNIRVNLVLFKCSSKPLSFYSSWIIRYNTLLTMYVITFQHSKNLSIFSSTQIYVILWNVCKAVILFHSISCVFPPLQKFNTWGYIISCVFPSQMFNLICIKSGENSQK